MIRTDLGAVTAYAYAVAHDYTGTEEEFGEMMANSAEYAAEAEAAKDEVLSSLDAYVGFRRYLTSSDDVFGLDPGVYGISPSADNKPSNLPPNFRSTGSGTVVILESHSSTVVMAIVFAGYDRRLWMYTGYQWNEVSKVEYVNQEIKNLESGLYDNLKSDLETMAQNRYTNGTELSATLKSGYFFDINGERTISGYDNWYITNEIDVTEWTFYSITASAQYYGHLVYCFYDANGNPLFYEQAETSTPVSYVDKLVLSPPNAAKVRLATINGSQTIKIKPTLKVNGSGKWIGKKWVCIGDSLTDENERATKRYHDYVAENTGISVVNLGEGGTGYKREFAGVGPFIDRVDSIPLDSDVVTIFGSGNDNIYTIGEPSDTGTSTLCGCINETIAAIFNRITTCQLGIVTPTPWEAYNPSDDTNWMAKYSEAIVEICKRWGIPCLDLYHCSNLRPWDTDFRNAAYSRDEGNGVHPDENGHKLIAPRFEAFLDELLLD